MNIAQRLGVFRGCTPGQRTVRMEVEPITHGTGRRPVVGFLPFIRSHDEIANCWFSLDSVRFGFKPVVEPAQHGGVVIPKSRGAEIHFTGPASFGLAVHERTLDPGPDEEP